MAEEWELSDDEMDAWLEEWAAVDRAAAEYLAEHVDGVVADLSDDEDTWVQALGETISPSQEPAEHEVEAMSAVMALQHADWLGLALGVVRRGPGSPLDPEVVQADIEGLDDVEGEIDDPDGHLAVLEIALSHLAAPWWDLGVLDEEGRVTERGVWGLPKALYRIWGDQTAPPAGP